MANPTVAEIGEARAVATGAISGAPTGTTLATDATTALNAAFKAYGYVSPEGIVQTRDVTTDDVRDMNGDVVYTLQTEFGRTYQAKFWQYDNVDLKKAIFGSANVTTTAANGSHGALISVVDKGLPAAHVSLSVDTFRIGGTGVNEHDRTVVPDAQPVSIELGPLVGNAVRSYTVTWKVFKDASANYVYEYSDDGITA